MLCEPNVFDYIKDGDATIWEQGPMESLTNDGQMFAFKHHGFWRPMDTLKDKHDLNDLWDSNKAPWKIW
jgi:glucose-1-phosphate cytidylyltransferase